jgi:hypothetical protein
MVDDYIRGRVRSDATFEMSQNVRKLTEPQLGGSTAATCVLREANHGWASGGITRILDQVGRTCLG